MLYSPMPKPTALVKPVSRPGGSATLRLVGAVAVAALATVALGVVTICSFLIQCNALGMCRTKRCWHRHSGRETAPARDRQGLDRRTERMLRYT